MNRGITGGVVLIALGTIFLLRNFYPNLHLWPLLLIALGLGKLAERIAL